MKTTLQITGMHCASCSSIIEKSLNKQTGVESASVSMAMNTATIEYDENETSESELIETIRAVGYDVADERDNREQKAYRRKFVGALILTLPVAVTMFVDWASIVGDRIIRVDSLMVLFTMLIVLVAGRGFHVGFIKKMRQGQTNMDTLISIGTLIALFYGVYAFGQTYIANNPIHFYHFLEGGSFIITFILLGKYLEYKSKGAASRAIQKLMELQVKEARVLVDGEEKLVSIDDLSMGDIVVVRPGDKLPVDGEVVKGSSDIDESMLTGESVPVGKQEGDEVYTGTIALTGKLHVEVTKEQTETMLSQIIAVVHEAQSQKPPIQHLVDKVASYFVWIILVIAVITFIIWLWLTGDVERSVLILVSTIVIACPCAMGLATPVALMVASGKGASHGILIKSGESLEKSKQISVVVFDKTGTLTAGKPQVTDVVTLGSTAEQDFVGYAAALAAESHHPLSKAVVNYATEQDIPPATLTEAEEISGKGLKGHIDNKQLLMGNQKLLDAEQIKLTDELKEQVSNLQESGKTVNFVVYGKEIAGLIAMRDDPKPDAIETIKQLKKMHIQPVMISGDTEKTVAAIAKQIGIEQYYAEVLPDEKADHVKLLQKDNAQIAFVGDGINDAPALAQADLGIAIGHGSDVAIETAEMVLVQGSPSKVVEAIRLARKTYRIIKQNLFWAFGYNAVLVPVAALGLLLPMFAGLAMSLSSVSVVLNSLRLKRAKL